MGFFIQALAHFSGLGFEHGFPEFPDMSTLDISHILKVMSGSEEAGASSTLLISSAHLAGSPAWRAPPAECGQHESC